MSSPIAELESQLNKTAHGAEPWKAGPMTMSHWILVPEAVAASAAKLKPWVHLAHAQALTAPPKAPKKPSAKPAKKSAAKKRK
jgi:hypothetical protein